MAGEASGSYVTACGAGGIATTSGGAEAGKLSPSALVAVIVTTYEVFSERPERLHVMFVVGVRPDGGVTLMGVPTWLPDMS
jgi:hypothetical protein